MGYNIERSLLGTDRGVYKKRKPAHIRNYVPYISNPDGKQPTAEIEMAIFEKVFNRPPRPGRPRPTTAETFDEDVLANPKPVVVDFWASWCSPCQVMGGLIDELGPQYAGKIEFFKLNIDQAPEIAAEYGVRSVPTLVFFHEGAPVGRIPGLLPLGPLTEQLERLAAADKNVGATSGNENQPRQES